MKRFLLAAACCLLPVAKAGKVVPAFWAPTYTAFVTGQNLGTLRSDFTGCAGFLFTVGGSNITVTHVGWWVVSGNSATHTVYILNTGGSTLASGVITTSGSTPGGYVYVPITPLVLTASTQYGIMGSVTNGGDQWYNDDTTLASSSAGATMNGSAFNASCPAVPTALNAAPAIQGLPNFRFH